jgi:hypothetical protein
MRLASILAAGLLVLPSALAQEQKPETEAVKKDIAAHRQLAAVHENAAKCLEAGKSEKECHEQLQKDCKGVGIGKYCGLRHKH